MNQDDDIINKKVFREVYIILNKLNLYNRLPEKLREYIKENQDEEYMFDFNEATPLIYQLENDKTKAFLTYVFIKYINTNQKDANYCKTVVMDLLKDYEY